MLAEDEQDQLESGEPEEDFNFAIIILAAGSSSRMGTSKQMLEIDGEPLLIHAINVALASGASEVILVLGANEQLHLDLVRGLPVKLITNHYWKTGMGSSIKTGLHHVVSNFRESEAVVIMVCDQPAISTEHIKSLVSTFLSSKKPIIAASYSATVGVPVLFARSFFSNILMLPDDQGAKKIIVQFPDQVVMVDIPEASDDLDTPEDYDSYTIKKKKVISD
ncbi:MAG: nucleotidyltransferase family protein [Chryseolinea sp.]